MGKLLKHVQDQGILPPEPEFIKRTQWIKHQQHNKVADSYKPTDIKEAQDGLLYYAPGGQPRRVIVPKQVQTQLVTWQHHQLMHPGYKKVYSFMKYKYFWKGMGKTCQDIVHKCAACQLLKAQRMLAHKHFRAKQFCTPRTSYAMDYYGVFKTKEGYCQILGIIDLATNNLVLQAHKVRTAVNTAHTILYEIVVRKGCPKLTHSDAAGEFLSKAMESLCSIIGCARTTTKGHNPRANSVIERVWAYVGNCLRMMTKQQYENFHLYLPLIAAAWNSLPSATTGISPFEAEHGMKARSIADSLVENPTTEGMEASADDLATIATSARAFHKIAAQSMALAKVLSAEKLNSKGKSKHLYKVGDKVTFY